VTLAGLEQGRQRGADRQRHPEHVGQHHLAPVLGRLLQESPAGAEAGVGEDGVDTAEAIERGPGQHPLVPPVADVAGHRERTLGAAQLLGQLLHEPFATRGQHQPIAGLGCPARALGADAARGAGDQQDRITLHGRRLLQLAAAGPLR
jgi:hypothetical protein